MPTGATGDRTRQIAEDLWLLDVRYQGEPGVIASYLLVGPAGLTLVDVGPAATADNLLGSIRATGHAPTSVRHLVLTHIHLDHAGAAGTLIRQMPHARVYVHPLGAPHLIDPTKLLASARRIYGDQTEALWGVTEPVPAERVTAVADGDVLQVGGRSLTALYTPGHAIHHIAFHDPQQRGLFAGDVAGVRLEGIDYVRPPTPPPDLSLEDWSASIARIRNLGLLQLYLPHFGVANGVEAHLRELEARLYRWGELVVVGMRAGKDVAAVAGDLQAAAEPELEPELEAAGVAKGAATRRQFELATSYLMTAQGYDRYYRKQHPERLADAPFL